MVIFPSFVNVYQRDKNQKQDLGYMVLSENVVLHPPISTGFVASVSHLRPKGGYFDVSQNVITCYTLW